MLTYRQYGEKGKIMEERIKLWSVTTLRIGAVNLEIWIFTSREEAEKCYKEWTYADKPHYMGQFAKRNVYPIVDFYNEEYKGNEMPEALYFRSYEEMKEWIKKNR